MSISRRDVADGALQEPHRAPVDAHDADPVQALAGRAPRIKNLEEHVVAHEEEKREEDEDRIAPTAEVAGEQEHTREGE